MNEFETVHTTFSSCINSGLIWHRGLRRHQICHGSGTQRNIPSSFFKGVERAKPSAVQVEASVIRRDHQKEDFFTKYTLHSSTWKAACPLATTPHCQDFKSKCFEWTDTYTQAFTDLAYSSVSPPSHTPRESFSLDLFLNESQHKFHTNTNLLLKAQWPEKILG